jgi:predicted nucleotidyltransferase
MTERSDLERFKAALRQHLPELAARFHVQSLGIFGSYVRHEEHAGSDLDVLVSFDKVPSLLRFIQLENYLTDLLGVKVDLVMEDALRPHIGERIHGEVVGV